ncbi:hypothetical protein GGR53DRAFT_18904 [Hypoxylon sp. FL1150]|nr:hypothetical protein GGR53DRAFT_18904 [Hypoxylon sp. FL1150]
MIHLPGIRDPRRSSSIWLPDDFYPPHILGMFWHVLHNFIFAFLAYLLQTISGSLGFMRCSAIATWYLPLIFSLGRRAIWWFATDTLNG